MKQRVRFRDAFGLTASLPPPPLLTTAKSSTTATFVPAPPPAPVVMKAAAVTTSAPPPASQQMIDAAVAKAVSNGAQVYTTQAGTLVAKVPVATIINPENPPLAKDPVIGKAVVSVVDTSAPAATEFKTPASYGPPTVSKDWTSEINALKRDVQDANKTADSVARKLDQVVAAVNEVAGLAQSAADQIAKLDQIAGDKFDEIEKTISMVRATLMDLAGRALVRKAPLFGGGKVKPQKAVQGFRAQDDDEDDGEIN
jgi:hypothetical protein